MSKADDIVHGVLESEADPEFDAKDFLLHVDSYYAVERVEPLVAEALRALSDGWRLLRAKTRGESDITKTYVFSIKRDPEFRNGVRVERPWCGAEGFDRMLDAVKKAVLSIGNVYVVQMDWDCPWDGAGSYLVYARCALKSIRSRVPRKYLTKPHWYLYAKPD